MSLPVAVLAYIVPKMLCHLPCREVVDGLEVLEKLEGVDTETSGIFVMPKGRVEIFSSYLHLPDGNDCEAKLKDLQDRYEAQSLRLEKMRSTSLP